MTQKKLPVDCLKMLVGHNFIYYYVENIEYSFRIGNVDSFTDELKPDALTRLTPKLF